jgi:hypothetical protein
VGVRVVYPVHLIALSEERVVGHTIFASHERYGGINDACGLSPNESHIVVMSDAVMTLIEQDIHQLKVDSSDSEIRRMCSCPLVASRWYPLYLILRRLCTS